MCERNYLCPKKGWNLVNKPSSLAVRFAGKEAVIKALGIYVKGIGWKESEILSDSSGQPLVYLYGKA